MENECARRPIDPAIQPCFERIELVNALASRALMVKRSVFQLCRIKSDQC
jgi:hypothetical protein